MASSTLPKPGTEYGPCEPTCHHTDCALTRQMALAVCPLCGQDIGYDVPFYQDSERRLAHARCVHEEAGL